MKTNFIEIPFRRHRAIRESDSANAGVVNTLDDPAWAETDSAGEASWGLRNAAKARIHDLETGRILVVSDDMVLMRKLFADANEAGWMITRVNSAPDALRMVEMARPSVVLLDLDLPADAAWEAADCLLQQESCPAVVLAATSIELFDARMVRLAQPLVDKSEESVRLLEVMNQHREADAFIQAERNSIQRTAILLLRSSRGAAPFSPPLRHWGINE